MQYVERPRGEDQEMDVLTPAEVRQLIDAQPEPLRTLVLMAILTGMRQGELFGLLWEDIDFVRHQVHVRRSLWHGTLGTPKSRRSRRAIDMPPTLERALQQLRAHVSSGRCASGARRGAKREQSSLPRASVGAKREQKVRRG